jgi:hypothetical protein
MNEYLIKSITEVFEDNFEKGEGKGVNVYGVEGKIEAESPRDAVLKFIANNLYFTDGTLEEDIEEGSQKVYCTLVDNENNEPNNPQIEAWKRGEIVLYSSYTRFTVSQLIKQTF